MIFINDLSVHKCWLLGSFGKKDCEDLAESSFLPRKGGPHRYCPCERRRAMPETESNVQPWTQE